LLENYAVKEDCIFQEERIPQASATQEVNPKKTILTGLTIEEARFVPAGIEIHFFLIHQFIAIDSVLFRIAIHGMIPPIKEGVGLVVIHRIPVPAALMLPDFPSNDIIAFIRAFE
jgi:hypothetical protein